ncbi:MAG TPA: hypothetical protein VK195_17220 [Burkholderiaceae bacterium]|nr:hypothetical protein [Burkholderiaceae bacterium]
MSAASPWRLYAGLALCCGLVGWYALPDETQLPELVRGRKDNWTLPELPRPLNPGGDALVLAAQPIWGPEPKAAPQAPPEDTRWRLAGLYGRGKSGGAVVMFMDPAKAPQRLKVGDKLPDGRKIEAVDGAELVVRDGKKKPERIGVERSE